MSGYTQADLDAMDRAIASGTSEVRMGDRMHKYRTLEEMMRARKFIAANLVTKRQINRVYTSFNRGLAK